MYRYNTMPKSKASKSKSKSSKPRVAKSKALMPKEAPLIGLIASKNPVSALETTVTSLFTGGASRVIVVDDGSDDPDSLAVFDRAEKLGAEVVHLKKNVGKARALRAGFWILPARCVIVQTDDDTLAGNLAGPLRWIREGKADIVDIRVETVRTTTLLGLIQELDYWLINAVTKRLQNFVDARLWMSGASVMYSHDAGEVMILQISHSITEDTEGMYRARAKGFRMRYYAKHDAQFITMVPEDFRSMNKQWRRWSTGNGQVMGIYGLGGGNLRIATVNVISWVDMLVPIPVAIRYGLISSLVWAFAFAVCIGVVGAIRLKRPKAALVGMFLPLMSWLWTYHAYTGLVRAYRMSKSGKAAQMTWVSPKRTSVLEAPVN
jgi:cellulose synthase/poly-beta-1,6-N-acetylglucosamine synthase-like glycosyltransferase